MFDDEDWIIKTLLIGLVFCVGTLVGGYLQYSDDHQQKEPTKVIEPLTVDRQPYEIREVIIRTFAPVPKLEP
jgi:hypothetical protein